MRAGPLASKMNTGDAQAQGDFLRYSRTIGLQAMTGRGFQYPTDTAIADDGRIYVANRAGEGPEGEGVQVTMCGLDSEYFGTFGSGGAGDGQFIQMSAIAMDGGSRIYVSDEYLHRISVFDPSGGFLSKWGERGAAPGELDGPCGMAFDQDDNLYVVDQRNNRVQKFDRDGRLLASFGSRGSGDGEFDLPWGITVAPDGDIYVADWRNDRIQRFTPEGRFVASHDGDASRGDRLHRPAGVAVDREGNTYVADWGNDRFKVYDPSGGLLVSTRGEATLSVWAEEFLEANAEEAEARATADLEPRLDYRGDTNEESSYVEKYFWGPISVELDGDGRVYVVDCNRHRIQIYERTKQ